MNMNPILMNLGNYPMATVQQRALERRRAGLPLFDFSIGDPKEPTPAFIPEALRAAVPAISQYPTAVGRVDLRTAIADWIQRRHGVTVDPETQVIPTSGSKEAIFNTHFALVDPDANDVVVVPSPGYPVYERGAVFAGAQLHRVVLDGDFVMRASAIPSDVFDATKIVWNCSPHSPSGAVTSAEDMAELYQACRDHGAWLLSDECYTDTYEEEIYPDGPVSALKIADSEFTDLLVFFSLSKRSGMTGYRSGAIVGDANAIQALRSLRATTGTASPDFVQVAAAAAWSDDEHVAERRSIFAAKRRILERAFAEIGMDVVASRAGLYLWVRVDDDLAISEQLLDQGVVVTPGRFFGVGGEGYIRLALVPALEECEQAAEALVEALT